MTLPSSVPRRRVVPSDGLLFLALDHFPPLEPRERAALLDPDNIADVMLVTLVVSVVFFGASHGLLHDRMGESALDPHDHGLVLLVADHNALQRSLWHSITPAFPSPRRRPPRAPASARRWS